MVNLLIYNSRLNAWLQRNEWPVAKDTARYMIGCLLVLLAFGKVLAAEVKGLYSAEVLVAAADPFARQDAMKHGLIQVLVKVTGEENLMELQPVTRALKNPQAYVSSFSLASTEEQVPDGKGKLVEAKKLLVTFEQSAINKLIEDAWLPRWGSNRPTVLLWIAVETNDGRKLLSTDDEHPVIASLAKAAGLRGVPLLMPLMDLTDEASMAVSDVWGLFEEPVLQASQRYQADNVLMGRIYQSPTGDWYGHWRFLMKDQGLMFDGFSEQLDELALQTVGQMARLQAKEYAIIAGGMSSNDISITIDNVSSVADYANVTRYLEKLAPVKRAKIVNVKNTRVAYELETEGGVEQLEKAIDLGEQLTQVVTAARDPRGNVLLHYRWTSN